MNRLDDGDSIKEHEASYICYKLFPYRSLWQVEDPENAAFLLNFFASFADQLPSNSELKDSWLDLQ